MRSIFILVLLEFSVVLIACRPSQTEENNESQEELEYEEDNAPTAEDNQDDSRFGEEDSSNQDTDQSRRLLELNRNNYLQKNLAEDQIPRTNLDAPDYKPARSRDVRNDKFNEAANNDEFQTYGKRRSYTENNDANEKSDTLQRYSDHGDNNYKNNHLHNEMLMESPLSKRTFNTKKAQTEDNELLENSRDQTSRADKNEYLNGPKMNVDLNQRQSYAKQFYNQIKPERVISEVSSPDDFSYYNRERREAKKSSQGVAESISSVDSGKENLDKSDSENEEMAIKRHIKKMTGDEIEQLLNSLSEEKRALLKKIMEDDDMSEKSFDAINKREITKKAGAVEDNGFIESGQSESSNLQGGFSSVDATPSYPSMPASDPTTNKQTEVIPDSAILSSQQKSALDSNSENKVDFISNKDKNSESCNSFAADTDPNKNSAAILPDQQAVSKNENKRETNTETVVEPLESPNIESEGTKDSRADDSYFFPPDGDMSQFLDDVEQSRSYDSSKIYKRHVDDQSELDSKMKSLEESFPNSVTYDESAPLIRVKRKNTEQVMRKRSAAVLPEAKVGYYPYKSDSSDDDSDEGNEFDDDGFYDPTPNLVNNDNKNVDNNPEQPGKENNSKLNAVDPLTSSVNDDTMNLGSDTDNVLSGVEGVDENLMFSSGLRNRRKTDGNIVERVDSNGLVESEQSKASSSLTKSISNNDVNVPSFQENDSFGGFPHNYESELGRYKRIRRVKQSRIPETPTSA